MRYDDSLLTVNTESGLQGTIRLLDPGQRIRLLHRLHTDREGCPIQQAVQNENAKGGVQYASAHINGPGSSSYLQVRRVKA
ncbi:hypothetical protein LCGC14_1022620 [marine sediment metagenome]|uniref:Uncharacterized protein n=1 Tax=marine sediment metagenome TaxID=412755 RepID=A0A0F9N1I0_9ZZZZ